LLALEALFLVLSIVRSAVQFLRSVVGDVDLFSSPAQEDAPPAPTPSPSSPQSSPSPLFSSPSSLKPSSSPVAARPQVFLVNPVSLVSQSPPLQSSASPNSPSNDETVTLTIGELLEAMGLPEDVSSMKALAELGVLPNEALAELGLLPDGTSLPSPSSPPSYLPPHARQQASKPLSPVSSPPASYGPPYVSYVKVEKGCFYCHIKEHYSRDFRYTHWNHCP
jgi:hypothetical protein